MSSIEYADLNLIEWINYPNTTTPLNQTNLRAINGAIAQLVVAINDNYHTKQDSDDTMRWLKNIEFNEATGVFTVTRVDNSTFTVDTKLEKLAINFRYDSDPTSEHYQSLIITLDDGSLQYVDMSALLTQYEFTDSSTVAMNVDNTGAVSANVIDHSIGDTQMQVGYLTNVRLNAQNAAASETNAKDSETNAAISETNASNSATLAQSWAVGGTNTRAGENTNNAKFWAEKTEGIYHSLGSGIHPMGTITFANLPVFAMVEEGYMYNISDAFTSDSRFKDGSGKSYAAGSNVYAIKEVTTDANDNEVVTWYWDVFAPSDQNKMNKDGSNSAWHVKLANALTIGSRESNDPVLGVNSVAVGNTIIASGDNSVGIGSSAMAFANNSIAVGTNSQADGDSSTAIGKDTLADADYSCAEGQGSQAHADYSHAAGYEGTTQNITDNATSGGTNLYTLLAIGSRNKVKPDIDVRMPSANLQEIRDGRNIFSVDDKGNVYMNGAPYQMRGVVVNRLVAQGDTIELEDGAEYLLFTHTRITSTGAWRGMQAWLVSATYNPLGIGTTSTGQALPVFASIGAAGTVGCNLSRLYEEYTTSGGVTAYHSKLGIGTCTTNMTTRYSLLKVVGSEEDFVKSYGV